MRYFFYSANRNAALDYENKLNRNLASINASLKNDLKQLLDKHDSETTSDMACSSKLFVEKKLASILEMINYSDTKKKLSNLIVNNNKPMVLFRCSKCGFETIDLCLLRLHKQEHYFSNEIRSGSEISVAPSAAILLSTASTVPKEQLNSV